MSESLLIFKYYADPLKTGVIVKSSQICSCCQKARGYVYALSIYTALKLDLDFSSAKEEHSDIDFDVTGPICPWCIFDGSAAEKFEGSFNDVYSLSSKDVPQEVIDEIEYRTPGFVSMQGEQWLSHCQNACVFHGDAPAEEIVNLTWEQAQEIESIYSLYFKVRI